MDNDLEPSARDVVAAWSVANPVRYVHEPRPGIAAARNRVLDECAGSDAVIFIDDDERPGDGWISALVDTWRQHGSTGVAGPVISRFGEPLDPWIAAGGWFARLRHPTGSEVPVVATNNLLLDVAEVRRLGVRFDEEFGLTGGSDTVFALQVVRAGGRFVWSDEAAVVDVVPPARATRRWVVRRAFRSGNSGARAAVRVADPGPRRWATRVRFAGRGTSRLVGGLARGALGLVRRDVGGRSRGLRTGARGAGMVAGAFGYVFAEYARGDAKVRRAAARGASRRGAHGSA